MGKKTRSARGWSVSRLRPDSSTYTVRFKHADGWRRLPGFTDATASDELGRRLRRLAELQESGLPLSPDLLQWVRGLPERTRSKLESWRLIDPQSADALKSLDQHLADWRESMVADGRTDKHVSQQLRMVEEIVSACRFKRFTDIDAAPAKTWISKLKRGIATKNHYKQSLKQFARLMCDCDRAGESLGRIQPRSSSSSRAASMSPAFWTTALLTAL